MNKLLLTGILSALLLCGCDMMTGEPAPTPVPEVKEAAVVNILDEYAILSGHTLYTNADGGFSIQLPEGSVIDDADPNNVTATVASEYELPDTINIKFSQNAKVIDTEAKLMDMLVNDNTIDITGFFLLKNNGAYEGYKFTYTSMTDPQLKGIKSVYFANDGTAYEVTATIVNGGDEITVTNINTIVDTFTNHR